jgi:hypothetical protein
MRAVAQVMSDVQGMPEVEASFPVFRYKNIKLIATDELLLKFREDVDWETAQAFLREMGFEVVEESDVIPNQYVVRRPGQAGFDVLDTAEQLQDHYLLEYAEPNFIQVIPTMPRFHKVLGTNNPASSKGKGLKTTSITSSPPRHPREATSCFLYHPKKLPPPRLRTIQ